MEIIINCCFVANSARCKQITNFCQARKYSAVIVFFQIVIKVENCFTPCNYGFSEIKNRRKTNCFCIYLLPFHKTQSFSKQVNSQKRKLTQLQEQFEQSSKKLKIVEKEVQETDTIAEDDEERTKLMVRITDLEIKRDELQNLLKNYRENDPKVLERKAELIQVIKKTVR